MNNAVQYILLNNNFILYFCLSSLFVFVTLCCNFLFFFKNYKKGNKKFYLIISRFLSTDPSLFKKFLFGYFLMFNLIPNKMIVHTKQPFLWSLLITVTLLILSNIWSIFSLVLIIKCCYIISSLIFGMSFHYSTYFKRLVKMIYFNKNSRVAKLTIFYFYGNPTIASIKRTVGVVSGLTGYAWRMEQEKKSAVDAAMLHTYNIDQVGKSNGHVGFTNLEFNAQFEIKRKVLESEEPLHKIVKSVGEISPIVIDIVKQWWL
jgi:hypothetical protein